MTPDVKGKTKATGAKGTTKATGLKEFLSNLATDPRKLGEFLHEPEAAMSAANLSEADKTALRSGVAGMVAARLAGVPLDQAFMPLAYLIHPEVAAYMIHPFAAAPQYVVQPPPQYVVHPPQFVVQPPPQYVVYPPQFVVQPPPQYVVHPPQFVVQPPPQYVVYPPQFVVQPPPYYPR
jgi:hypothetical protein